MLSRHRFSLLMLCALMGLACTSTRSMAPGWELLGERTVNHAVDRDEIVVTAREGTFRRIRLQVKRRAVTFRDVKVHYANGAVQDVDLRREIPAGGESRAIDLNGQDRVITKVVFWYNTSRVRGKRAVVQLYGLK